MFLKLMLLDFGVVRLYARELENQIPGNLPCVFAFTGGIAECGELRTSGAGRTASEDEQLDGQTSSAA